MSRRPVIIALAVFATSPCFARIITVDDNGPADFNSIQAAINDANNGDIILVQPGIYTGDGNRDIDFLGKAITVKSENGPENCIIDCDATYEDNHRGFYFVHNEGRDSVLDGLTITNAYVVVGCEGGAGIYIDGASPTINNCIITANMAELLPESLCYCYGGAIYIGDGSYPLFTNCIITNNSVGNWGRGGGIYCSGYPAASAYIQNCIISDNIAVGTESMGGGIYCDNMSELIMSNCTVADNLASQGGGGIHFIKYTGSPLRRIRNSIIWSNSPEQIHANNESYMFVMYSDVSGGWSGTGNIDADPCFADAANNDYHLKSETGRWNPISQSWVQDSATSPCIDAGNSSLDWTVELWPHGKRINMGAYGGTPEASMSLSQIGNAADLNNNSQVDYIDLMIFVDKWLCRQVLLPEDLDRNGAVNFIDFAIFANNWFWEE